LRRKGTTGRYDEYYDLVAESEFFDADWYRRTYGLDAGVDAVRHYLEVGSLLEYFPSKEFPRLWYKLQNLDVVEQGVDPFIHYLAHGIAEKRQLGKEEYLLPLTAPKVMSSEERDELEAQVIERTEAAMALQDERIVAMYPRDTAKLIVFIVPPTDYSGGGVLSINSIARVTRDLEDIHGAKVMIATEPSINTFADYTAFEAAFPIFRFEQLREHFDALEEILIHIPETYVTDFLAKISPGSLAWLQSIEKRRVNILNQNIFLLQPVQITRYLRRFVPDLTMTIAHSKYCVKQLRSSYDMPVHFLSTSNLIEYDHRDYADKDELLVYSEDYNPYKENILDHIAKAFPGLEMIEIKNMTYPEYLETISRAKWMITFGEGVDGYFLESCRCGAVAFSVFNFDFFDERFDGLSTVYSDYSAMYNNIVEDMRRLDNPEDFTALSELLIATDAKIYDHNEYKENIRQYYLGNYTLPYDEVLALRQQRMDARPLISIVMATYNGERFLRDQLDSLLALTYENIELIVSDDGSDDGTMDILREYTFDFPTMIVNNPGPHGPTGNFGNALRYVKGEYVALCDQDDIWEPDKLETLLEHIEDYDIVYGRVKAIDIDGKRHGNPAIKAAYETDNSKLYRFDNYLFTNHMLGCASLIRTDLIKPLLPFSEEVVFHDWWIVLAGIVRGGGICFVDKEVISYRQYGENTAYTFFNNPGFQDKLYRFNRFIAGELDGELDKQDRMLVEIHRNWCKLYGCFANITPVAIWELFNFNLKAFSEEALVDIRRTVTELLEGTSDAG
jgi:glycosyltransferase involved in cell wall biosynthesis